MEYKIKRVIMAVIGIFLCGISVAIFKTASFGTDPFTCLNLGLSSVSGIAYGIVFTAVTAILLLGVFIVKRHYIGIATVLNMLFIGAVAEKFMLILGKCFPHPELPVRILLLFTALIIMCFASSLYFTADLGVSAYDAWALILADHKVAPFRICRIATDIVCVVLGALMGELPGIGTLITAFGMGPFIDFFNRKFSIPFLQGSLFHYGLKKA